MRRGGGGQWAADHQLEIQEMKALTAAAAKLTVAADTLARAARTGGAGGRGGLSLAGVAGGGGLAGGLVLATGELALFAAGLVVGLRAVTQFAQALASAGSIALATGGSRSEIAGLSTTLAAAGIPADEIPGIAGRVRALRGGGRAAAELGFQPSREVAPELDEARGLADVVGQILDPLISEEQALAKARLAGLEPLLDLRKFEAFHRDELAKERDLRHSLADPQSIYNAQEFVFQLREVGRSLSTAGQVATQYLLPALSLLSEAFVKTVDDWASKLDWLAGILGFKSGGGAPAATPHTQAVKDNTEALKNLQKEFANGGIRTNAAVPRGLGAEALEHYLQGEYFRAGGYAP